jgi:5-(carboxyamino)imidazole ribonucleotide mutase
VPVIATPLDGFDALLSIVQMPAGVGVATVGVGAKGAENAGIFAARALGARGPGKKVVILAGDNNDLQVLQHAAEQLDKLDVPHEKVIAGNAAVADLEAGGAAVFIAGSASGIGFACAVARATTRPVLAVPIVTGAVGPIDDFLRPFLDLQPGLATFAVGRPGAINAALFAATIISGLGTKVWAALRQMRAEQTQRVRNMKLPTNG